MLKPLSHVSPNASYRVGDVDDDPLTQRPKLAVMAMQVIASWSLVEIRLTEVFVSLLGGLDNNGSIAYLAITSRHAKANMITAIAKKKLSKENFALLSAIQKLIELSAKERSKIAHCEWGYSHDLPDAILLKDPKKMCQK